MLVGKIANSSGILDAGQHSHQDHDKFPVHLEIIQSPPI